MHAIRFLRSPSPFALLAASLLLAACAGDETGSDDEERSSAAPGPAPTTGPVEPLPDDELEGLERENIAMTLPWSGGSFNRAPAPSAAAVTLEDVATSTSGGFDRLVFRFSTDARYPGYRVTRPDSSLTRCGTEDPMLPAGREGEAAWLLVRIEPAQAHTEDDRPTIARRERRTGYEALRSATQVCDTGGMVEWLLALEDSVEARVLEMRSPPRLVVDLRHPGAGAAAGGDEPADSAAGSGPEGG